MGSSQLTLTSQWLSRKTMASEAVCCDILGGETMMLNREMSRWETYSQLCLLPESETESSLQY